MELNAANHACSYIIQSQEDEIKRIALELHEGINQNLYSLYTGLGYLESGIKEPHMKSYAKEMASLMERTIQEVRLLSVGLYPNTITTLGLEAAIKSYAKLFTDTFGVLIAIKSSGRERTMAEQRSMTVFRVCQEALINIAKYADASSAEIQFTWKEKSLKIEIKDAGKGFNLESGIERFTGIAAMKERMLIAGGQFYISSEEGKGTTVTITLPI
ncbi:sensor histidine kinase [Thalassobacillus pellis]|uniref:sensor histidine kinase n=1 Tax=Thalassobacillus pellis TaxID=748008 RepID=UPI0019618A75|nr:ATP-binding protein [Thalassobacillus pellis]MBM7554191.1 two-component system sensor histidine kinase NreB [Thalassobacillus pellis]